MKNTLSGFQFKGVVRLLAPTGLLNARLQFSPLLLGQGILEGNPQQFSGVLNVQVRSAQKRITRDLAFPPAFVIDIISIISITDVVVSIVGLF